MPFLPVIFIFLAFIAFYLCRKLGITLKPPLLILFILTAVYALIIFAVIQKTL